MKRVIVWFLMCVCFASCSSSEGTRVEMDAAQRFSPATITVPAGTEIEFVNSSSETHTVTAYEDEIPEGAGYFASGGLDSEEAARADLDAGLIDPGKRYEVSLDVPGTYEYFCIPHESQGMVGTIVVEPE